MGPAVDPLFLSSNWIIPASDLSARFVRSGGPGGQNVNKVATKVELRFELQQTRALSEGQKARLSAQFPSAVTRGGEFVIFGDEHRSQSMNLEATRARLRAMILSVRLPPRVRRPTQPSRSAKRRRLDDKQKRAQLKKQRGTRFD
jgi:ribosome-associated protein